MSYGVKCSLCEEPLTHNRSETSILVQHLIERHPEQQFHLTRTVKQKIYKDSPLDDCRFQEVDTRMAHFSAKHPPTAAAGSTRGAVPPLRHHRVSASSGQKADENLPTKQDFTERDSRSRSMYYKTTVASWRPGRTRVSCPHCGESRLPTIRSSADRYCRTATGAAWLLTCWPLCFLPCLFTAPAKHRLHCSGCDAYLGLYDPNREVVGRNPSIRQRRRRPGTGSRNTHGRSSEHE